MERKDLFRMSGILLPVFLIIILTGCAEKINRTDKLQDLDFTVIKESEIPEELAKELEEKKQQPMQITFADQGYLYIVRGYGAQLTSGYSIQVKELYETTNGIVIGTELLGPSKEDTVEEISTFPYIVVKLEFIDKHVIFQ